MIFKFIPVILVLTSLVYSQDKSVIELQSEFYSQFHYTLESQFDHINPHSGNPYYNINVLNKHVFGWNPYWVGTAYSSYNYSLLSTVAYFSYEVDTATGGYTDIHFWRTTNLIPLAHSNNVKVVLTVTNFGSAQNTAILSSSAKRQRLIDSLINLIQFRQADGVNIDFEIVSNSQRTNLVTFMNALASQMHSAVPNSKVSIDVPAVDWNNSFNVTALNNVCDQLIIMGYDYYWSGSPNAGPVAPLQGGSYNVTNSVNYYINNGASSIKLLLGVPYYGYEWPTVDNTIHSQTTGTGTAYQYSTAKTRALTYGRIWDPVTSSPWYRYQSTGWRQGWYDDSVSLGLKYDQVNSRNLAGIGIWALSYDGSNNELWNVIALKFGVIGIIPNTEIPKQFWLYQNYPNPFNPSTVIRFDVSGSSKVSLNIYNIQGKEIVKAFDLFLNQGSYEWNWHPSDDLSTGVYFYILSANGFPVDSKRMIYSK